ncbi:MAG: hypothetical protein HQL26_07400 [Candidatus Omnitrophica bacterium]|nr:hypothetical protein [Candidatus Omnitrophota bacterium]
MARGMKKKAVEFEKKFYEGILQRTPDFIEALIALGDVYTLSGEFEAGLKIDEKLALLRSDDAYILYNLACSYSLLNYVDLALETIKKAILCGYDDFAFLQEDEDLHNLRKDYRFQSYLGGLKNKIMVEDSTDI